MPRARALLDDARSFWSADASRYARQLNETLITRSQIEHAEGHADVAIATLERMIGERRALVGAPDYTLGLALVTLSGASGRRRLWPAVSRAPSSVHSRAPGRPLSVTSTSRGRSSMLRSFSV